DDILNRVTMQTKFQQVIQNAKDPDFWNRAGALLDISGPLRAPYYAKLFLKWAADLILRFEELFWMVKKNGTRPLTRPSVETLLDAFGVSDRRKSVHGIIKGDIQHSIVKA